MPNGDNWQGDVLRDLTGGTAGPPEPAGAAGTPAPAAPSGQPAVRHDAPSAQQGYRQTPRQAPQQAPPPQTPHQAAPAAHAQPDPQQQYPYQYRAAPAPPPALQPQPQPQPQPAAVPHPTAPTDHRPQPQPQPSQPHAQQPQPTPPPQHTAAPHPRTPRSTPESRPVVDKELTAAGRSPRRGESFATRALRAVRRTVSSSAAREVAESTTTAAILQQPVTTGRQIAVTSIRGGSGKTTVAALLTTTYAHYRQDPVLAVEADPALGSLPLRLGAQSLRWTAGVLADVVEPQMSLLDVTGYLVQLPENAWLLPGSQGEVGAMLDTRSYERIMVSLRRYFGMTVVDCETLPAEVARTALSAAQARVLTAPATLEGVASTQAVLDWMRNLPRDITTSTVVVLTETAPHSGVDLGKAAQKLGSSGASVRTLPYDRHLAAGGTIRTELLSRATRQAATALAAEAFRLSQKRR